jgi:DNA repair exonuclease SbcCD ATPase subunit
MMQAAITNDFSVNAGPKDANICALAGPKSKSYIELHFRHGDAQLHLIRGLQGIKSQLVVNGGAPLLGDVKVNEALSQILGIGLSVISQYVFIPQGKISDFLDQTSAKRSEFFQTLFGTARVLKLHKLLGDRLTQYRVVDYTVASDAEASAITQLEQQLVDYRQQLAAYGPDDQAMDRWEQQARDVLATHHQALNAQIQVTQLTNELTQLQTRQPDRPVAVIQAELDALQAQADQLEQIRPQDELDASIWSAIATQQASIRNTEAALTKLGEPLPPPVRPESVPADFDSQAGRERYMQLSGQYTRQQTYLDKLGTGVAACPTCGTSVTELAQTTQQYRESQPQLHAEMQQLQAWIQQAEAYAAVGVSYALTMTAYNTKRQQLTATLDELRRTLPTPPTAGLDEVQMRTAQRSNLRTGLAQLHRERQQVETLTRMTETRIAVVQGQLAQVTMVASQQLPADQAATLTQQLTARDQWRTNRGQLQGFIQVCEQQLTQRQQTLTRLRAAAADQGRKTGFADLLAQTRELFHRDALPKLVAATHLENLEATINEILQTFDAPFQVRVSEDLSFTAHFQTGFTQPAGRLSGGQKDVLCLAFLTAVNTSFAGDLGLFCPDEPTGDLDEHNVRCLEAALVKLKQLSSSKGLQVIMPTHEQRLAPIFDAVIRL